MAIIWSKELLKGQAADGEFIIRGKVPGKVFKFAAWGTFGSGTCKMQELLANTWTDVSGATMTTDDIVTCTLSAGHQGVKCVLTGATNPSINAVLLAWE